MVRFLNLLLHEYLNNGSATQAKLSSEIAALKVRAEERKLQKLEMQKRDMFELEQPDVIEGESVPVMALDWDQAWD